MPAIRDTIVKKSKTSFAAANGMPPAIYGILTVCNVIGIEKITSGRGKSTVFSLTLINNTN